MMGLTEMNPSNNIFVPGPTKTATLEQIQATQRAAMVQFDIDDYVSYADVWQHTRSKLQVKSCDPAQVTTTVSNWIIEIKNLIMGLKRELHASRLKFYADASLNVSEELLLHVAHNSEGHVVNKLLKSRYSPALKRHEIKLCWRELSKGEDSWEPADVLL
ncbi:hypothetical protein PHMEG_00013705 [Phytophthora megakarya]|uniref:Chromo domain-containing protein n=1 Tax=Phytophthora megakarya TaxID=4795 RepID=A0A225W7A1_9STRA|nr:hypothetical protein PHMEG_00013705 [Phytophthora megakarya]